MHVRPLLAVDAEPPRLLCCVCQVLSVLQSPPLLELLRQVEAAYAGHVAARHAPGQQANLCIKLEEQMRVRGRD